VPVAAVLAEVRDIAVIVRVRRICLEHLGFLTRVEPSAKSAVDSCVRPPLVYLLQNSPPLL
jgi:hypothetical protein